MRMFLAIAGAALALAVSPAQAATVFFGPADMNISFGPGGTVSAHFGESGIVAGTFEHIYQFTLPQSGRASGTISTSAVTFQGIDDLDLVSVYFNGVQLTGFTGAINEVVFANLVPIHAGQLNEIIINGLSRGNGSYGGQGVFAPVPEPAAWAMLIGGFGFAGMALRRRTQMKVSYSAA
jgi:hypothetical protein